MKILIVDDSRLIRMQTINLMTLNFPDIQFEMAEDGESCLRKIKRFRPDIVLLDIVMPGISGIEVLQKIQSQIESGAIKVLMFSSMDDQVTLKESFELGASDFIRKPLEEIETIARVEAAIKSMKTFKELIGTNERLESKNKELIRVNKELLEMKNRLSQSEKMAGIGELARGIADEISTPVGFTSSNLNTLKMYSEYWMALYASLVEFGDLKKSNPLAYEIINSTEFVYMISDIEIIFEDTQSSIESTQNIIQSLKSFSQMDLQSEKKWVDINQGIKDALAIVHSQIQHTAKVSLNLSEVPLIWGFGSKINQVFLNIFVSSIYAIEEKFGEEVGIIEVSSGVMDDRIHLEFCDNGSQIFEEVKLKLLSSESNSKTSDVAREITMSLATDIIVNMHGGKVYIKSDKSKRTCIMIELPID